jgi:hypothetical protein
LLTQLNNMAYQPQTYRALPDMTLTLLVATLVMPALILVNQLRKLLRQHLLHRNHLYSQRIQVLMNKAIQFMSRPISPHHRL